MVTRYCCPECFGDRGLRKDIIPSLSNRIGKCDYCHSENVVLIEPERLADVFEMLVDVYEGDDNGKFLVEWMKLDWGLFQHKNMDTPNAKELLADILNNGEIVRKTFSPSETYKSEGLIRWSSLRDELMFKNRYFLDVALDSIRLTELLSHLTVDDMPNVWYRARIRSGDSVYKISEMGAPPRKLATNGRANPIGIPYLYLGSTPETAVSEVRPHPGDITCVAEFDVARPLVVVDLRDPRRQVSPFLLGDPSSIGQMRADIPFLERLGEELTRPVVPSSAAIDYLPSQYLCEFIKKCQYDGVVYRSSMGTGINLALFDPAKAQGRNVLQYKIEGITVNAVLANL